MSSKEPKTSHHILLLGESGVQMLHDLRFRDAHNYTPDDEKFIRSLARVLVDQLPEPEDEYVTAAQQWLLDGNSTLWGQPFNVKGNDDAIDAATWFVEQLASFLEHSGYKLCQ